MIRVAKVNVMAISMPLRSPVKMAGVTVSSADNLIICVNDDAGRGGWGEASSAPTMTGEFPEGMVAAGRFLANRVKGVEFYAPNVVTEQLGSLLYGNFGVLAAFESAILDLLAQARGIPLCDLLGGKRRSASPVLTMVAGGDPDTEVANAKLAAAQGFTAFKVKIGTGSPEDDLRRCRMIREALGPEAQVSADANQGYDRTDALVFAEGAQAAGLDFMEQLVAGHDLDGMAACAAASAVPLGADEGIHSIEDIRAHHAKGAARGGSLKAIKLGGLVPMMAAGDLMASLDMHVNLAGKIAETSIASAATAHLAVALPRLDWGTSVTNQYLTDDVSDAPIRIIDGQVCPPEGPGLGIRPDPEKLEKYRMRFYD